MRRRTGFGPHPVRGLSLAMSPETRVAIVVPLQKADASMAGSPRESMRASGVVSRRKALGLAASATAGPALLGGGALSLIAGASASARPYGGQMKVHISPGGSGYAGYLGFFRGASVVGVIVGFRTLEARPAIFMSLGSIALCSSGRKLGFLYLTRTASGQMESQMKTSTDDVFTADNQSQVLPGFYEVQVMRIDPRSFDVAVNRKVVLSVRLNDNDILEGLDSVGLGDGTKDLRVRLLNMGSSDCDFLVVKSWSAGFFPNFFAILPTEMKTCDLSRSPPQASPGAFWNAAGPVEIEHQASSESATLGAIARELAPLLAPVVRLHSRDQYRPSGVEWFLKRTSLLGGSAERRWDTINHANGMADPPSGLSMVQPGPLTDRLLGDISNSIHLGGANSTDFRSLWPMSAAPGQEPHSSWSLEPHQTPFSDYQLETLAGEPLVNDRCVAPCYCRLSQKGGDVLITYYLFFPYNGDLMPRLFRVWDAKALADNSGFEAHIGDWERVTLRLRIDPNGPMVALLDTTLEFHGNREVRTEAPFAFGPRAVTRLAPFTVYSAWHSHAMHGASGTYPTDTIVADDVLDDGPIWSLADHLVYIDEDVPWVRFNGLWGANVTLTSNLTWVSDAKTLKNGPDGPAYHDLWTESYTIWWISRGIELIDR